MCGHGVQLAERLNSQSVTDCGFSQSLSILSNFYPRKRKILYIDNTTNQGWQVCDELVITAGKNTVITGSSQTTLVVANRHKPSQTQNVAKSCLIFPLNATVMKYFIGLKVYSAKSISDNLI